MTDSILAEFMPLLLENCCKKSDVFTRGDEIRVRNGVADGTRTRNNQYHKLGIYH